MGVSILIFTELQPEMRGLVLLAAVFQLCQGAPQVPLKYHDMDDPVHKVLAPVYITETEAFVPYRPDLYYSKREAKADPQSVIVPNINIGTSTTTLLLKELSKVFG